LGTVAQENAENDRLFAKYSSSQSTCGKAEQGLIIREKPFALVFTVSHSVADARYFFSLAFAARCTELRSFATEFCPTVD